ncbi:MULTISPECIES: bifunctional ADP-dependent NAD(P)H-hydrate dehydratase/NAD(P)H-hydrate epimerase [Emticicia]|uniref:bifunctional ADP-dependent NAD(P)H-hydrate dehydratase/NAD(P)H-hydrate epimerase n=1 Tax=Emticicia TaxID=312278 RepID=UPI0007D8CA45|nr:MULTISPECIES: bifunctional ADP-dependent NAD(P)H-hydrate dehydratase/NAD(P)H-hydrate epimerase [Emticicia]
MKILSLHQIREADCFTIEHEPIASIDLMERASRAFVNWFCKSFETGDYKVKVFCGLGDNGGDGLAISRMLHPLGYDVEVYVVKYSSKESDNFNINFNRLKTQIEVNVIDDEQFTLSLNSGDIIIDALLGSGISRSIEGLLKTVVEQINKSEAMIISVDIPSGLLADKPNNQSDTIIKAFHTVSFQVPKLAFMLPQNAEFVGNWHIVDIGLYQAFINKAEVVFFYSTPQEVEKLIKPRAKFSHKGTYGHALLIAGSYGMMGAAILSARACMRSGVGKLTVHSISSGLPILQTVLPEAMYWEVLNNDKFLTTDFKIEDLNSRFQAVGVGPGIGVHEETGISLIKLCRLCKELVIPMVLDADALNIFASQFGDDFTNEIPENSILTPHPKEFRNLVNQSWNNDYEKLELLRKLAIQNKLIVCLKGANTAIALPNGTIHFNSSGNAGMATAGSGDVLTGIITALLAQGYSPDEAAILGVYMHGKAGDIAAEKFGMTSMIASDIIENIRF